ncbi:hypothetical protein Bca52824_046846 [Brassica carinata]|uniref:Uncharacterized protein n=1 Tax=Brassica carinata TaxID=52824 RepID=A0A8X7RFV6_BRACI|nr:hypothetical protein Bca52824_046846 [Brassica carinata]
MRSLYSASAQAGLSGSTNRVEECMGQYPGILRGRILTWRLKLRILRLDSTGLACASRACKGCNGLSGGSPCRMFVLVPGDNLVDSWYRSRSVGLVYCNLPPEVSHNQCWDNLALCSHGIWRILGMLSQNLKVERFSSWNPEAGWTVVKESVGCVDLQGDLRISFDSKSSLRTLPPLWGYAGVGRKFNGVAGNIGIKGDAFDHTPGACAASVAILGLSSGRALWFHESCGGVYGSVPRNSERQNLGEAKDQEDEELLASSQDCTLTFGRWDVQHYCNLPPEVSHNQCWDNLALCSHGIWRILGMLSQNLKVERFSSWNPEAGWTVVKESVGCVDLQGDLLVYPFDSKSSLPGRLLLIPR